MRRASGRREGLVEHAGVVCVEVVADQDHLRGLRTVHVHQVAQDCGEVPLGAPGCDLDRAPTLLGCGQHKQVAGPVPVLVVVADRLAGCRRLRHARFRDQLLAGFVHADHRAAVVRGTPVDLQHILHVVHEDGIGLRGGCTSTFSATSSTRFFERPAHRFERNQVHHLQGHQFGRQQFQRPDFF